MTSGGLNNVVALLNNKGGVGKTTVTLGLASAAAAAGANVLVVDLDPQASATWTLGVNTSDMTSTVSDVFDNANARDAIVPSTWGTQIDVLGGDGRLQEHEHGQATRLRDALTEVASRYDVILIDCPPALGNLSTNALAAARHALIVVDPSALGLRGIGRVADLLDDVWNEHNLDLNLGGVIVNRVPAVSVDAARRYDELTRVVGEKSIWQPVLPSRVIVNQASAERRSLHSLGRRGEGIAEAFDTLWARLATQLAANLETV